MSENNNAIVFEAEDGSEVQFKVVEQTTLGGINYLLVTDMSDEEAFLILKESRDDVAGDMLAYDIVEDEKELEAVVKIFDELLEDVDLEV